MELRIRSTAICVYNGKALVFKGIDPKTGQSYWFLPGGKIEKGEAPWECAERETFEETGYRVSVLAETEIIKHYSHWWNGTQYYCKSFFYRANLSEPWHEPGHINDDEYNKGAHWLTKEEACEAFSYTPEILEAFIQTTNLSVRGD